MSNIADHIPSPTSAASDRHRPGIVLMALAFGAFAVGIDEFGRVGLFPRFWSGAVVDVTGANDTTSVYMFGIIIGGPLITVLAARIGRRTLLVILLLLIAISDGLSALAPNETWFIIFRFLAGLPNGAYLGVASLTAAALVPHDRRGQAVARVLAGLAVAIMIGVPFVHAIDLTEGWRWSFGLTTIIGIFAATLVYGFVNHGGVDERASTHREFDALRCRPVWLTFAVAALGLAGMLIVYAYAPLLIVTAAATQLGVIGSWTILAAGLMAGNCICGLAADRSTTRATGAILAFSTAALVLYSFAMGSVWTALPVTFLIGCGGGLAIVLQIGMMDTAEGAQASAAALNHSAFTTANALGPWLTRLSLAAGLGQRAVGWVGAALALGGLMIWGVSLLMDRPKRAEERLSRGA